MNVIVPIVPVIYPIIAPIIAPVIVSVLISSVISTTGPIIIRYAFNKIYDYIHNELN